MTTEFGAYSEPLPLVLGSVRGVRAWRFEKGRLQSPHANGCFWSSGEQIAQCGTRPPYRGLEALWKSWEFRDDPDPEHVKNCVCGFYAHYQGVSDYELNLIWGVVGVIEGYGTTTLGTKGFRCQKAKIVALAPSHRVGLFTYGSYNRPFRLKALRQAFPDIPVYRTFDKLLLEHPATRYEDVAEPLGRQDLVK